MKKMLGLGLVLLFFSSHSQALDVGVGVRAGVNGFGAEFSVALTETINARIMGASIDIDDEDETIDVGDSGGEGEIDAELEFDYGANALFIDWHVFNGSFHVTAGMFRNDSGADVTGVLVGDIVVDGQPINQGDLIGDIDGEIELADSYQPYIGIGWGRRAGGDGGFTATFDLGVALLDPEVSLDATVDPGGNFADQAELEQTLRDLESDAEDDLDDYELWPVLSIGLNYAF